MLCYAVLATNPPLPCASSISSHPEPPQQASNLPQAARLQALSSFQFFLCLRLPRPCKASAGTPTSPLGQQCSTGPRLLRVMRHCSCSSPRMVSYGRNGRHPINQALILSTLLAGLTAPSSTMSGRPCIFGYVGCGLQG